MADIALASLLFLFDVVRGAFALWRRPLSFVLFLWLTSLLNTPLLWVASLALKPLCGIPGVDRSHFCVTENTASHVNYPRLIEAQTLTFEKLLDNTVGGSGLSLEIKKAELAVVELVTLVEYSQLTNRYVLVDSLTLFVQDARSSGRGLQLLSSKVYGAVDLIIAVNECTMNTLSSISSPSSSIFSWALTPFYSRPSITREVIREAFVDSMITLAGLVENLILLAEVELMNIDRLEEHLSLLHVLTVQEDTAISSAKTELLRDIWTLFGGNRRMLKGYDKNLELLHGIGGVRRQAWAHVTSALRLLKQLRDDMEVMQETLSRPKLPGVPISTEAHIRSIELGVERLKDSRAIARKKDEEDVSSKKIFDREGTKIIYVGSVEDNF